MFEFLYAMPSPIVAILGFMLTISFLVAIHEYGHFWVARKFGVKIEKFSIGFGKPIVKWHGKRDNTEYSLSWIPLGGYVKMYGENPSENLSEDNKEEKDDIGSFSALPPLKRFLIAFAGPAVNLLFAVFAMWVLLIVGIPASKPYVGTISDSSALLVSQIQSGDRITAIDDEAANTITDVSMNLIDRLGSQQVTIHAQDNNGITKSATVDLSQLPAGSEMNVENALGFQWEIAEVANRLPATLATVEAGSPAAAAHLQVGDNIIQANEQAINHWQDFVTVIKSHPGKAIALTVMRNGQAQALTLTPKKHPDNPTTGYAGISPAVPENLNSKYETVKRYDFFTALPMAVNENYLLAKLTLKTLGRLIVGRASVENMGGPLTIADYSGKTLKMGYVWYFKFLAAISLTLAVMNLLPIPILDGGHMTLCTVEMIRGKPLSERTANVLLRIGMSVMLTFMLFVLTVDLWKYLLK